MASASPVSSGKIGDSINAIGDINGVGPAAKAGLSPGPFEMPKQSLRGMNKPKCIKCGNVARSRCPFQSCKSCCAKAENPCHIHVLKQGSTLPDKPPPSVLPVVEQVPNDVPSNGSSWRLTSLRHLSTNFASLLRSKTSFNRKAVVNINKWRFMKLREHIQGNVEAENEAFERYMSNVNLLEETFFAPEDNDKSCNQSALEANLSEDEYQMLVSELTMKLKSDTKRADQFRERIKFLINQKLNKLDEECATNDGADDDEEYLDERRQIKRSKLLLKERSERCVALDDLIDKLNKARTEEEFRTCLDLKLRLASQLEHGSDILKDTTFDNSSVTKTMPLSFLPKIWKAVHVDQDSLTEIDQEFSSLSHVAEL